MFTLIALMAGVSVLVCSLALVQLGRLEGDLSDLGNDNTGRLVALARLQGTQAELNGGVAGFVAPGVSVSFRAASLKVVRDSTAEQDRQIEDLGRIADADIRAAFPQLRATWGTLHNGIRVFVLREQPLAGAALPENGEELADLSVDVSRELAQLTDVQRAESEAAAEAGHQTYRQSLLIVILTLVVSLFVVLLLAGRVVASLVRPIRQVSEALDALADGNLRVPVLVFGSSETGRMAASLRRAQETLSAAMSVITTSSQALTGNSQQLSTVSNEVARTAEQTSDRSTEAARAAEEVSRNVETVAAATEQMGSSIREISSSSTDALRVAAAAVDEANKATRTVAKLGDSSAQIGNVIKTITSIAEQTNLLALNATIEAARAGEAGKGFAVVASEVKELAQETARATEDISGRVEAIQLDVEAAVEVIARISQIIEDVNAFQTTIASAVEEQSATSEQIAHNVVGAAAGSRSIATNIEEVAGAARASSAGIEHAKQASEELASLAGQLQQVVAQFSV